MEKTLYTLIAFSVTDLIGINRLNRIKKNFKEISDFLDCDLDFQMSLLELKSDKAREVLKNMKSQTDIVIEKCEKQKIDIISYDDPQYPPNLKTIMDPPYILYKQGKLEPQIPLVAVIGTRNSTPEAEEINRWFCKSFVEYGLGIVSGLARGHDSVASETALKYKGFTVGVLGTAIDVVYPKTASRLYDQMKENGAILSEYPPGMASTKWRFPRRNRIVSGMSQALFVMQAPKKSGTMITVNMAMEQGRDVFVIPGNPMKSEYIGSNYLIQHGAKIALDPYETIEEILKSNPNLETMNVIKSTSQPLENDKKDSSFYPELSLEEQQIMELTHTHIHADEILRKLEMNTSSLNALLTIMELKGLVIQKPGRIYIRGV